MDHIKGPILAAFALLIPAILFIGVGAPAGPAFSLYIGSAALIAMALVQIMATRLPFVEALFGPLDQVYRLHKWLGIGSLVAVFLHDAIGAEIAGLITRANQNEFGEALGEFSLNGLIILLAITLLTFIPYRIWYWTHRAMGIAFLFGAGHYYLMPKPYAAFGVLDIYILTFCGLGAAAYLYTLLPRGFRRNRAYEITSVDHTGNASAFTMSPVGKPIRHQAGQFAFFTPDLKSRVETHPFSISSAPNKAGDLRISVANLGDYTALMGKELAIGDKIRVQGPYGRFLPLKSQRQVWIAAGIGITPFLAWLDALPEEGPVVDLIFTFRDEAKAPHLEEVKRLVAAKTRVTLHMFDTAKGPRLTAEEVVKIGGGHGVKYAFCGPSVLRNALLKVIPARDFHYDLFEIRTGLFTVPNGMAQWFRGAPTRTVRA